MLSHPIWKCGPARRGGARVVGVMAITACLGMIPSLAAAQQIGGTVTDTTGAVLPGVTVEAKSPALIEQVRTVITNSQGQYLIAALQTGVYTVTFTLPGFRAVAREGVRLTLGFTAQIDGKLVSTTIFLGDIRDVALPLSKRRSRANHIRFRIEVLALGNRGFERWTIIVSGFVRNGDQ